MRYRIAITTYMAFAAILVMRTAFPFVQFDIAKYYGTDEKYLGILSAVTYIIMGVGYFIRNLLLRHRIVHSFFIECSLSALFYLVIPVTMFFDVK